jgi:nuclear pore complex protein Nup155
MCSIGSDHFSTRILSHIRNSSLGLQRLNLSDERLLHIHRNLSALQTFLDNNPHLFQSTPGDPTGARAGNTNDAEAWKVCYIQTALNHLNSLLLQAEKASVAQLQALLHRSVEGISFVLLLHDYHLEDLIGK